VRRRSQWAIGLGVYVAALAVQAPATLVDAGLKQATNGRLRLAQPQGTIWAGAGLIEIRDVSGRNAISKELTWRVSPESLWRARLVCEVELDRAARRFPLTISFSGIELANVDINLPAAALAFAEPRLQPLRLAGDVLLHATNVLFGRDGMHGAVTMQWLGAVSAFSPVSPIGSYELRFDGRGNSIQATLSTLQGPLQLDGSGTWIRGSNPAFQATARVPPNYQEQLTPLLRLISVQRDEATFDLRLK